ncbi:hypothetical protein SLS54_000211 [Diplodia seriata]
MLTSRSDNFLKRRTVAPWTAEDEMDPAERSLEPPRDFFLQPATYTASNPSLSKPEPQQLPLLQPRRFELLIPDPSREPSPEVRTPAFEYEHHVEFPPSPASSKPPQTPLPPIPGASTIDPVAKPKDPSVLNRRTPTPPSPAPSPKGTRVVIPATTTVSEGASFVISPFSLTSPISPWTGAEDPSPYQNHYQQSAAASTTSPRRLVPRSAAPGADDEWEEDFEEETARIRRDRLSQDYHQALVEQYRELVSPTSEIFGAVADMEEEQNHAVLRDPPSYPKPSKGGDKDNDGLVPLPLKPRRDSPDRYDVVDRSSPFPEDHYEPRGRRRSSLLREKLPALAAGTLNMILPSQHHRRNFSAASSRSGEIPISPPPHHETFGGRAVHVAQARTLRTAKVGRPRSRAFPAAAAHQQSTVARGKTKKRKTKGKKGKNEPAEHAAPPLTLTLTSSLSTNDTSSTRPSVERGRRLNANTPIPTTTAVAAPATTGPNASFQTTFLPAPPHPYTTSRSPSAASSLSYPRAPRSSPSAAVPPPSSTVIINRPPTPSPLAHGLSHTEILPPSSSSSPAPRPTYPRKMSSGPPTPASAPSSPPRRHRRKKSSTTTRIGLLQALGLGKGEGSGHSGNSSGTRLPFVHETSPSPSPPPSDRRKNRKSSSSSAAATRMPQIRSLAAAAMRSPSHSPSPPPPPPSSSSSPSTLDKEQQRDGGGSGGGRSGASSWRLSTSVKQQHQHLSLYKKAVEAHRSHQRERRQQEMKKSIRVLGQTDPQQVVREYVRVAAGAVAGPGIKPAYNSDNGNDRSTGGGSGNGGDAKEGGEGWL